MSLSSHPSFVLASQSPRRRELLGRVLPEFEICKAEVEEALHSDEGPEQLALENAVIKARWVAERYRESWVIGSDTVVACDGVPLGKPETRIEAIEMMRILSGRSHSVHSGVLIMNHSKGRERSFVETSSVSFFQLNDPMIEAYVDSMNPGEYAGGYPIQYLLGSIVSGFSGSFTSVVGLPLERIVSTLKEWSLIS